MYIILKDLISAIYKKIAHFNFLTNCSQILALFKE